MGEERRFRITVAAAVLAAFLVNGLLDVTTDLALPARWSLAVLAAVLVTVVSRRRRLPAAGRNGPRD